MRERRWSLGWGVMIGALAGACTRPNPAFDGGGEPTDGPTTFGASGDTVADGTTRGGSSSNSNSGSSNSGSSDSAGSDDPPGVCLGHGDCDDGMFCNGAEMCAPGMPAANDFGCMEGMPPCPNGARCDEGQGACVNDCADGVDMDGDEHASVDCGGDDCDDSAAGILGPGDWAHCSACNASCEALQACVAGVCVDARRVFATSDVYSGDLSGLEGADEKCQALAEQAELGGVFRAYIVGAGLGGSLERLEHPNVPFVRLDGVTIANGWFDLSNMSLSAPLNRDEWRLPVEGNAWTGLINVFSNAPNNHCNDWTFDGGGCTEPSVPCGGAGETDTINGHWDGWSIFDCNATFHLYCIEQLEGG